MATIDLTDRATVRSYMQKAGVDVAQDPVIDVMVTSVSRLLLEQFEREFAPTTADATRRFRLDVQEPYLDLAPYDLRTLVSVKIDPQQAGGGTTLVEYDLKPRPAKHGVFTAIEFYGIPLNVGLPGRYRQVDIRGAWGFATVPEDVKHWATIAVVTWLRGNVSAFSTVYNIDEGRLERPEALPGAVVAGLRHYRRRV